MQAFDCYWLAVYRIRVVIFSVIRMIAGTGCLNLIMGIYAFNKCQDYSCLNVAIVKCIVILKFRQFFWKLRNGSTIRHSRMNVCNLVCT